MPGIVKSARLGYDGKGQVRVTRRDEVAQAFERMGRVACVLERFVDLESVYGTSFGPVTVGPDSVFVLGDDREHSIDSRDFGDVPRSRVVGLLLPPVGGTCRSVP